MKRETETYATGEAAPYVDRVVALGPDVDRPEVRDMAFHPEIDGLAQAEIEGSKPTNPKDSVGIRKAPLSTVPAPVMVELGLAMLEGARKYGRHNYRAVGVRASVYYDACLRHMMAWWEGEDIDLDSGLSHVTKAIASLVVLRDSMIRANLEDDRPPRVGNGWMTNLNLHAGDLIDKYPDPKPAHTQK